MYIILSINITYGNIEVICKDIYYQTMPAFQSADVTPMYYNKKGRILRITLHIVSTRLLFIITTYK